MLLNILLQAVDSVSVTTSDSSFELPWNIIAIVEFVIILVLLLFQIKPNNKKMSKDLLRAKNADINTDNMMSDIFKSKDLYDKLIRKCHPDRFTDAEMKAKMTTLSQDITKNQHNYSDLCKIKTEIKVKYNLNVD